MPRSYLVFHGIPKGIWNPNSLWEVASRIFRKIDLSPNHVYINGLRDDPQSGALFERSFNKEQGFDRAPLGDKNIFLQLYTAALYRTRLIGNPFEVASVTFLSGSGCSIVITNTAEPFDQRLIVEIARMVLEVLMVGYGYAYFGKSIMYSRGSRGHYVDLCGVFQTSRTEPHDRSEYPKNPMHRWGWYLTFSAPRVGANPPSTFPADSRPQDLRGIFRDVYEHNVLGPEHLVTCIDGNTLYQRIESSSLWGNLVQIQGSSIYLWTIAPTKCKFVRNEMRKRDLLIAYRQTPP